MFENIISINFYKDKMHFQQLVIRNRNESSRIVNLHFKGGKFYNVYLQEEKTWGLFASSQKVS